MIPASGGYNIILTILWSNAGGPGFNSRSSPFYSVCIYVPQVEAPAQKTGSIMIRRLKRAIELESPKFTGDRLMVSTFDA
jgi:hypothetical protein